MKSILFSILIPSYNSKDYIEEAVKSVYAQKYDNFEIIICDQADTDSSFLLYKYKKIRIIHLQNPSTYNARCELIKSVKGDYFLSLDADDFFTKDTLFLLNKLINESEFKDLYIFKKIEITKYDKCYKGDKTIQHLNNEEFYKKIIYRDKHDFYYNEITSKCIKRIDNFSYQPKDMCNNEDCYLLLQLSDFFTNIVFFDCVLYLIRKHEGSASTTFSARRLDNQCQYIIFLKNKLGINYTYYNAISTIYDFYNSFVYLSYKKQFNKQYWKSLFTHKYVSEFICVLKQNYKFYKSKCKGREKQYLYLISHKRFYTIYFILKRHR